MGQEFVIKSQTLEDKVNQLLPSQGGAAAGVDLSASTTIIPIVDLTESAEGSLLRQDLQNAYSFNSTTTTNSINSRDTIINNTGYFRILGSIVGEGTGTAKIELSDGLSTKVLFQQVFNASNVGVKQCDFTVFLEAGDSVIQESTSAVVGILTATRQIATISGELVNP
tara:strand:+ start:183 stop:686 length:504 start_codon:yes stop_codon:yes gene_type:complete